jgi:hypothetical protein
VEQGMKWLQEKIEPGGQKEQLLEESAQKIPSV